MVDEWPMLAERIPHFGIIFKKTDPLATLDALIGTPGENQRTFQMEVIFELINGQRTVQQIMAEGFVGEFDTCKTLVTLMDAHLIEATAIELSKGQGRKFPPPARSMPQVIGFLLVGVIGLFLIYQLISVRGAQFPFTQAEYRGWKTVHVSLQKVKERQKQNARETFFVEGNRYPQSSQELIQKGFLTP
jgi:hypothetical protein